MSRLVIVFFLFGLMTCNTLAKGHNICTELKFVKDGVAYPRVGDSHVKLTEFVKDATYTGGVRYMLGNRINGDKLVAQSVQTKKFQVGKNVQLALKYSESEDAAMAVTFVEIVFDEGVNVENVYLVAGGIGQMNISIVVEAKKTEYLKYEVMVYGQ